VLEPGGQNNQNPRKLQEVDVDAENRCDDPTSIPIELDEISLFVYVCDVNIL
jgi:hypothetical protein